MHRRMDCPLRTTSVFKRVFVERAVLLHNRTHGSDSAERNRSTFGPARMESHRSRHVPDGVTRGNLEQRMIGFDALNSRELIRSFSKTGIAVFAHDGHLQIRRGPYIRYNLDRLRIADLSSGNRSCYALPSSDHSLHRLLTLLLSLDSFRHSSPL